MGTIAFHLRQTLGVNELAANSFMAREQETRLDCAWQGDALSESIALAPTSHSNYPRNRPTVGGWRLSRGLVLPRGGGLRLGSHLSARAPEAPRRTSVAPRRIQPILPSGLTRQRLQPSRQLPRSHPRATPTLFRDEKTSPSHFWMGAERTATLDTGEQPCLTESPSFQACVCLQVKAPCERTRAAVPCPSPPQARGHGGSSNPWSMTSSQAHLTLVLLNGRGTPFALRYSAQSAISFTCSY